MQFQQLYVQAGNTALVNDAVLAKQAVNDAIREIVAEGGFNFTESALIALTGGVYKYSLTTLLTLPPLKIHFVVYAPVTSPSTLSYRLLPTSMSQIVELQTNQNVATGNVRLFGVGDFDAFYMYPTPGTGDQIRFYYSADFADITVDATVTPLVPPHLHYVIVYVAARNLAFVNNAAMVAEIEPLAQAGLAKVKEYANTRRATTPRIANVGYPQNRIIRDPSQYWSGMN